MGSGHSELLSSVKQLTDLVEKGVPNDLTEVAVRELLASATQVQEKISANLGSIQTQIDTLLVEKNEEKRTLIVRLLKDLGSRTEALIRRISLQFELYRLSGNMLGIQAFQSAQEQFYGIFERLFPTDKFKLQMFSIQDDELIGRATAQFGDYTLENHGSGYQALFNIGLGLTRVIADAQFGAVVATIVLLSIDEPESHLHPHMQRYLVKALRKLHVDLAESGCFLQIFLSTHSPSILSGLEVNELIQIKANKLSGSYPVIPKSGI